MSWGPELILTHPERPQAQRFARPQRGGVDGQLVYAVGDIHGEYRLLKALLARITDDAATRAAGREPILVFCGDYVDRGPQSARVLEAMVFLRRKAGLQVRLLRGNHDQGLLDFIETPEAGRRWLGVGGAETLRSYGVPPPAATDDPAGLTAARDALLEAMPASHLLLLQDLELLVSLGDYAFAHAGVNPKARLSAQKEKDLLWIRRGFLDAEGSFEKVVVHGHTWTGPQVQVHDGRIGIDTGAYKTGVLTALRLEDGEACVLQVQAPPSRS